LSQEFGSQALPASGLRDGRQGVRTLALRA
jgi:hypothetical protein